MARFQGNIHAASDRVAATILVLVLVIAALLLGWYLADHAGFVSFWDSFFRNFQLRG